MIIITEPAKLASQLSTGCKDSKVRLRERKRKKGSWDEAGEEEEVSWQMGS